MAENDEKEPMACLFVCLWTAVRRFVRVRGCQADGVRAELRTATRINYGHINHNHGSDNDNHDRNDDYDNYYNRNALVYNNIDDNRKARAGR